MFEVIQLGDMKTATTKSAANHIYIADVSGSMYADLPKIRQHLKNIISVVAQPEDTFTLIWFSGKGQCGVVFENVLLSDLNTVQLLHAAIDKWLRPMGMTGFIDPINLSKTIAYDPTKLNNLVMLTDGYDNTSNRADILKTVADMKSVFHSVTFIEYGYYADRELLAKMAEQVGGLHIFAEGYTQYEKVFSDTISGAIRVNNISVDVNKKAKHCIFTYGTQIRIVPVIDGKVTVPEDTQKIYSVVPKDVLSKQLSAEHLYLVLYYAAKTENDELVWKCLEALGDVAMVELYQNAFTKQELSTFESAVERAVLNERERFVKGRDLSAVPDKNAPTVIDLLSSLAASNAELVTSSEYWDYEKTSRERVATEDLPKFVPSPMQANVPLHSLVYNSSRPNVSILTTRDGVVQLPENKFRLKSVPSFITRNYTIIRDGIKNVSKLPVVLGEMQMLALTHFDFEVIHSDNGKVFAVFDISKMPVINRRSLEQVTAEYVSRVIRDIQMLAVSNKVLKFYLKNQMAENSKTVKMVEKYGVDAAEWLSSIGVRDYGFNAVGTTSGEVSDEYQAIELEYKVKGMSSIPAIDATLKKRDEIKAAEKDGGKSKKTLNMVEQLICMHADSYMGLSNDELQTLSNNAINTKRALERRLADCVFALILGRKWFGDDEVYTTTIQFTNSLSTELTLTKVRKTVKI